MNKKNARKGTIKVTPTGERRLVLKDALPKKSDKVELTIAQVLLGEVTVTDENSDREITLKPLNLRQMAALKQAFPDFDAKAPDDWTNDELLTVLLCLANDSSKRPFTKEDIEEMVTADHLPILTRLLESMISPIEAASPASGKAAAARTAPLTGAASSTSSPRRSGGGRNNSPNSR